MPHSSTSPLNYTPHRNVVPLIGGLLAALIAFWGITSPEYWNDEAATVSAITRSYPDLLRMLGNVDAVHGLYYALMHPWAALFGTSELTLRTPSAIALAVSNIFLIKSAQIIAPKFRLNAQKEIIFLLIVGVTGATLPGLSWSGQKARGYAFGVLCTTIALWNFLLFLQGGKKRYIFGFFVFQTLAAGFTLYSIFLLPLYCFSALWVSKKQGVQVLLTSVLVGICILPLIYVAQSQSAQLSWLQRDIPEMYQRMYSQFFFSPANASGAWGQRGQRMAPWITTACILLGIWALSQTANKKYLLWLSSFIFWPMLILFFLRTLGFQLYTERYLIFSAPFVVLVVAISLVQLKLSHAVVCGIVLNLLFIPALVGQNESNAKINHLYKSAAQVIGEADGVIYMNAAVRNVGIAYLEDESIQDFMLAQDPSTSATLWGINKPRSEAYSVQARGKLAVVSYPGDAEHYPVVEAQKGNGCVELEHYESGSFWITVLDCS